MIPSLLPPSVVAVDAYEDDWETELFPSEAALVERAVERRRREFAAGRNCARRALGRLGWPDFAILAGEKREPLWPAGVVGSITHSAGYSAAAVARTDDLLSLGIDAERNSPLPEGVRERTCVAGELDVEVPGADAAMLVFSAKEAVYKAWFQLTAAWLDYLDAAIDLDLEHGSFAVRLLPTAPLAALPGTFEGRFAVTPEHVFTAVTVPAKMRPC